MTTEESAFSSEERQPATLLDVAQKVGVSVATISRTLNNKPGVGRDLRKKVMQAVEDLEYSPRISKENHENLPSTIGCVFQDLTGGWLITVFRGALFRLAVDHRNLVTALSTRGDDEADIPKQLLANQKNIAGLVWQDSRVTREIVLEIKALFNGPIVLLQNDIEVDGVDTVSIENTSGCYSAMKHLYEIGCQNIMLVTGNDTLSTQQKMTGIKQAINEFDIHIPEEMILNGLDNGFLAIEVLSDYLDAGKPLPDAIFALNDDMALSIKHLLVKRGIRIPKDIVLVGYDGVYEAERAEITTVQTPMGEMGEMAAMLISQRLTNPDQPRLTQHILLKGQLAIRESSQR